MKTISIFTCVLGVWAFPLVTAANGDEIPACRLCAEWREALGLGGSQAAAMGVNAQTLQTIAGAVETYCSQNRATVESLLTAIRTARTDRARKYELGTA